MRLLWILLILLFSSLAAGNSNRTIKLGPFTNAHFMVNNGELLLTDQNRFPNRYDLVVVDISKVGSEKVHQVDKLPIFSEPGKVRGWLSGLKIIEDTVYISTGSTGIDKKNPSPVKAAFYSKSLTDLKQGGKAWKKIAEVSVPVGKDWFERPFFDTKRSRAIFSNQRNTMFVVDLKGNKVTKRHMGNNFHIETATILNDKLYVLNPNMFTPALDCLSYGPKLSVLSLDSLELIEEIDLAGECWTNITNNNSDLILLGKAMIYYLDLKGNILKTIPIPEGLMAKYVDPYLIVGANVWKNPIYQENYLVSQNSKKCLLLKQGGSTRNVFDTADGPTPRFFSTAFNKKDYEANLVIIDNYNSGCSDN